jgi:hypothetical protein
VNVIAKAIEYGWSRAARPAQAEGVIKIPDRAVQHTVTTGVNALEFAAENEPFWCARDRRVMSLQRFAIRMPCVFGNAKVNSALSRGTKTGREVPA